MPQPASFSDTKTPPPPEMPPAPVPDSLPPSYPSPFSPYIHIQGQGVPQPFIGGQPLQQPPNSQHQGQSVQRPFNGQPLPQSSYGAFPPQQIPPGIQAPIGTLPPPNLPGQMPLAAAPTAHFSQPALGTPAQQMPGVNLHTMQAQLGAQYQAMQYAQCMSGNHSRQTRQGVLGIICAIVFFPIGLVCLFADRYDVCLRCGQRF